MLYKKELFDAALSARNNSHSPYSKFSVGAAILDQDNNIFAGCNIENASYSLTICAEAAAIANMVVNRREGGVGLIKTILIVIKGDDTKINKNHHYPCGSCLQRIYEFCGNNDRGAKDCWVVLMDENENDIDVRALSELLPIPFSL